MSWHDPVVWAGVGLVLAVSELLVPGIYLLWIGTGFLFGSILMTAFTPDSVAGVLGLQVASLLASILIGVLLGRVLRKEESGHPGSLNRGAGAHHIGKSGCLVMRDDQLKLHVGDSFWPVEGRGLKDGLQVKVIGVRGNRLRVALDEVIRD